jgi:transposase-like protein
VIVSQRYAEREKVQQFLAENVARLRFGATDRALLIAHARQQGEETAAVAARFGVSAATVRRLEAQLNGASFGEVAALRARDVNLALHAVIARQVPPHERAEVIRRIAPSHIRAKEMDALLAAIDWKSLTDLGANYSNQRLALLEWACHTLTLLPRAEPRQRIRHLALALPLRLPLATTTTGAASAAP